MQKASIKTVFPRLISFNKLDYASQVQKLILDIDDVDKRISNLLANSLSNVIEECLCKIFISLNQIEIYYGLLAHMNSVENDEHIQVNYDKARIKITEFYNNLSASKEYYNILIKAEQESRSDVDLHRYVVREMKVMERNGIHLSSDLKDKVSKCKAEISNLCSKYSNNLLLSNDSWFKHINNKEELKGISPEFMEVLKKEAELRNLDGWAVTIKQIVYIHCIKNADNRELRKDLHYAFNVQASELSNAKYDNTELVKSILQKRHELAILLGFNNFAEYSIDQKMSESPAAVMKMLLEMYELTKPKASEDIKEVEEYAKTKLGIDTLENWDIPYVQEKILKNTLEVDQDEVKEYLSLQKVLSGIINLIHKIYKIDLKISNTITLWNKDVIQLDAIKNNELVGRIYLDPYSRKGKRSGAWMDCVSCKIKLSPTEIQLPSGHVVCNFNKTDSTECLLTHYDMLVLFHEFGHVMHHICIENNTSLDINMGKNEWDAIELPSQFLERFSWNKFYVPSISKHYVNGAELPMDLFNRLLKSKNFMSGLQFNRQIVMSILDLELHNQTEAVSNPLEFTRNCFNKYSLTAINSYSRSLNQFAHLFSDLMGYAAGYYSYKYAEIMAAETYAKVINPDYSVNEEQANNFVSKYLANSCSLTAREAYINFMGRDVDSKALLKEYNLCSN